MIVASCPVLEWAASGAMWLTGREDGPPSAPSAPVIGALRSALDELDVPEDPGVLLTQRASSRRLRRRGATSVGGRCRLVRAADGWVAVNLAREEDVELVPAVVGEPIAGDPWSALDGYARGTTAPGLAARSQLVGIPAAALPLHPRRAEAPFHVVPLGAPADRPTACPLVVDLGALWAGPLCAHLLAQGGARVVKVEDTGRPDGSREGDPWLYGHLNGGADEVRFDFSSPSGRAGLRALVDRADVVIEGSRPRALRRLGLRPRSFLAARPGRTWVGITGYGRTGPWAGRVAFGDDAAVAAGLVAWSGDEPVFCADAVADPVAGVYAALGVSRSRAAGGGHLVDVAMRRAVAFACAGAPCPEEHPVEHRGGDRWVVRHLDLVQEVCWPAPVVDP